MCEILFRGKRLDNGEWIEGYLIKGMWCLGGKEITAIVPLGVTFFPRDELEWVEVDPDTVGRFTGVYDISGKRVFEGDVVKGCDAVGKFECIGTVKWSELFPGWHIGNHRTLYGGGRVAKYEVLRSVHDDPDEHDYWE